MLKKFVISMLGSIAGVWIAIGIGFLAVMGIVGAIAGASAETASKPQKHSALHLDLTGVMPERYQPADIWQMLSESEHGGEALVDVLDAIRIAASDSKIEGIYITAPAGGLSAGLASREEIITALRDFKRSGKWVVAYGDSYGQGDYMLASVADTVMLNPMGTVDVHGMYQALMYFAGLMQKMGVKAQIVRVGTYKSAVEPFMLDGMSEASREQTTVMLDSLWRYAGGVIADGRDVTMATVDSWADSIISSWSAPRIMEAGAVTSLCYRRQADDRVRELCGLDSDDELRLVSPSQYIASRKAVSESKSHVAVLVAAGDIVDTGSGGIVGDKMVPEILRLADDDNVAALVLRVNSGGGSAYASEQIWEALEYFKSKDKPFYVSMGDMAASGGYYISCGADRIYADHSTLTGSIGVFGMIPDLSGLVTDKLGINISTVATNPDAAVAAPFVPLNARQIAALQSSVDDIYETFTSRVAEGRGIAQDSVKLIAEGRVWPGGSALRLGLVDELAGLRKAVTDIAAEAEVDPDKVVYYPRTDGDMFAELMRLYGSEAAVAIGTARVDASTLRLLRLMDYLQHMPRVQARMMPIEIR